MAQDKLNTLLQVLLLTLQPSDKEWLITQMQKDLETERKNNSDLLHRSLDMSLQQIEAGDVFSHEQAEQIMDTYVNREISVAV